MELELLEEVPVCKFLSNEVADDYPSDKVGSIDNLYKEVKAVRSRSHNCSMAAFRSRIAQVTYIYNTMVVIFNSMSEDEQTEELEEKLNWVYEQINSMWEGHNEWQDITPGNAKWNTLRTVVVTIEYEG